MNKSIRKLLTLIFVITLSLTAFTLLTAYAAEDYYIVNKTSKKFHLPSCSYLPNPSNSYTIPRSDITKTKYSSLSPCAHCDPLSNDYYSPKEPVQSSGNTGSSSNAKPKSSVEWPSFAIPVIIFASAIFVVIYVRKRREP